MATLYVSEYAAVENGIPVEPSLAEQHISIGGSTTSSSAFNSNTQYVRLETDAICSVLFGTSPTAVATSHRMALGDRDIFKVPVGKSYKVAVITNT